LLTSSENTNIIFRVDPFTLRILRYRGAETHDLALATAIPRPIEVGEEVP
jgi:hypothetical protein